MKRAELLKLVGSVEQIGGVRDFTFNDGKAKGVRAIEVNTGVLRFTVLPDRCMDIAQAYYKGEAFAWFSKAGIAAPQYYDKDDKEWLRGFYGGLITTCGLKNVGAPRNGYGLHDRIAHTPAQKVSVFADWIGDDYVMKISGEVRDSKVFGLNLLLKRTITTKLFSDTFTVEDTVVNEGFQNEEVVLCYHCNFGYPLVQNGAKMFNIPEDIRDITAPIHNKEEECYHVDYTDDVVTVGIENDRLGAYITYNTDTLPDFLIWKMMGECEYVVGLEPRTICANDEEKGQEKRVLKPFEEFGTRLTFQVKERK